MQDAPNPAAAAPAPLVISTDRPSFSDGTGIQPLWHLNVETGWLYTARNSDETNTQRNQWPEVLLRLGLLEERLELRLSTSGYSWQRVDAGPGPVQETEGWNDFSVGLKLKVCDQSGWFPRLCVLAQSSVGSGSDSVSNQVAEPAFKLLWSQDLALAIDERWSGFTLGGNLNLALPTSGGERFLQGQVSVYLSYPLVPKLSGFTEFYALLPNSKDGDAACYVDTGVTYLLDPRVQLDARIGIGLGGEADTFYTGVGISFLF